MKNLYASVFFYFFGCLTLVAQLPTYGDCLGALPICDSIYVEIISPEGSGSFNNELHPDCCIENELNSIWYKFRIKQSGELGFTIIPQEDDFDYDWALFNITNNTCSDIAEDFNLIASCNAAGGINGDFNCYGLTGPDGSTEFFFQNLNCGTFPPELDSEGFSPFNDFIDVVEGELYALLILEFTNGVAEGFTIDFTYGDDVGIYDEERPEIEDIEMIYDGCTIIGFTVTFDEDIVCNSFNFNDLNITISENNEAVTGDIESINCDDGQLSSTFDILLDTPVNQGQTLAVSANEDPFDLCMNPIFSYQFMENVPAELDTLVMAPVPLCNAETTTLSVDLQSFYTSVLWSTNEMTISIEAQEGIYEAFLSGDCGSRLVQFEVIDFTPEFNITIIDATCTELGDIIIDDLADNVPFELNGVSYSSISELEGLEPGSYDMQIFFSSECDTTISFEINEISSTLDITGQQEYDILGGDSVLLEVIVNGLYDSLYWSNGNEIVCFSCESFEVSPTSTTEYTVTGIDEEGCAISLIILVRVKSIYDVYVPNVFSPNEDGLNDRFMVFGNRFLEEVEVLEIYDRWGERVYQGLNIEAGNIQAGWDGTFKNKKAAPGVYAWVATIRYTDGLIETLAGSVTIFR